MNKEENQPEPNRNLFVIQIVIIIVASKLMPSANPSFVYFYHFAQKSKKNSVEN